MNDDLILNVLREYYPLARGIFITGSQIKKPDYDAKSDFDLVVIGDQFSTISSFLITRDKYKFDCTQVPFFDIENILFNERYDPKGILLTMLRDGKILMDTSDLLIQAIKERATVLYGKRRYLIDVRHTELKRDLKKVRSELERDITYNQKFLLTTEFVHIITNLELTKQSNWIHHGIKRIRFLNESSDIFLTDLIKLAKSSINNSSTISSNKFLSYIDNYLANNCLDENLKVESNDRCVIEIEYNEFSFDDFIRNILFPLTENKKLSSGFLYCFSSAKQQYRIYNHQVCLVFKAENEILKNEFFVNLHQLLKSKGKEEINMSFLPTCIYTDENFNKEVYYDFENIAIQISRMYARWGSEKETYNDSKSFLLGMYLIAFSFKALDLNINDLHKANSIMIQRYIFPSDQQYRMAHPKDLEKLRNEKYAEFSKFQSENESLLNNVIKSGLHHSVDANLESEYDFLINPLNSFINNQIEKVESIIGFNKLTALILQNHCGVEKPGKILIYKLLFEQLIKTLNFNRQHCCVALFSFNMFIIEKLTIRDTVLA